MAAIVLISGWGSRPEVFAGIQRDLPETTAVAQLDWTEALSEPWAAVEGRIAALQAEDAGPPVLVGWSLGGQLALQAAARLSAPLAGLVLLSTPLRLLQDEVGVGADPASLRAMRIGLSRDPDAILDQFWREASAPSRIDPATLAAARSAASPAQLKAGLAALERTDLRTQLPALDCPVVVVHGERDRIVPAQTSQALCQGLGAQACLLLAEAGHALPLSHPAPIAQLIQALGG